MANAFRHRAWGATRFGGAGRLLGLGLLLACSACSGPPGGGRLGEDLGGFQVQASEAVNGCGAGALGSRPSFDFQIDLSRERTELFWGAEGSARLDATLGFELVATVSFALTPARGNQPGCSIGRLDRISGTLKPDDSGAVVGFTGQLEHTFNTAPGTQCSLDDRLGAGLPQLPRSMAYDLTGERSRDPNPAQPESSQPESSTTLE
jgi:hypothetical protein